MTDVTIYIQTGGAKAIIVAKLAVHRGYQQSTVSHIRLSKVIMAHSLLDQRPETAATDGKDNSPGNRDVE